MGMNLIDPITVKLRKTTLFREPRSETYHCPIKLLGTTSRVGACERRGIFSCAIVAFETGKLSDTIALDSLFLPRTVSVFPRPISSQSKPPFGSSFELSRSCYSS